MRASSELLFFGNNLIGGRFSWNENHAAVQKELIQCVFSLWRIFIRACFFLMRQRNRFQMFLIIKGMVREFGNSRVHASLFVKNAPEVLFALAVQPFEERVAAVGQSDSLQKRIGDRCLIGTLLGDGRQLLVITYEDKLLDGIFLIVAGRQDTDQVRFENLRSFVNNSQVEPLEVEEMQAVIDGRRRTYKDTCAADFFLDVCQFGTVFQAVFQQVGSKPSVT